MMPAPTPAHAEGPMEDDDGFPFFADLADCEDEPARPRVKARRGQAWTPHFREQVDLGQTHFEFGSCGRRTRVRLEYLLHGTGSSVWDSAVVTMAYFENRAAFPHGYWEGKRVLELGAGTGILGLHAAKLGASEVVLTDLGDIVGAIEHNIEINRPDFPAGTRVRAVSLPWGSSVEGLGAAPFDIVLVADCILPYAKHAMALLCDTLVQLSNGNPDLDIILAYEERFDASEFFSALASAGFVIAAVPLEELHPVYNADMIHVMHIRRQKHGQA